MSKHSISARGRSANHQNPFKQSNAALIGQKALAIGLGLCGLMFMTVSVTRSLSVAYDRFMVTNRTYFDFVSELITPIGFNFLMFLVAIAAGWLWTKRSYGFAFLCWCIVFLCFAYSSPVQLDSISASRDAVINDNSAAIRAYDNALKKKAALENWFLRNKIPNLVKARMLVEQKETFKRFSWTKGCDKTEITQAKSRRFCSQYAALKADLALAKAAIAKREALANAERVIDKGRPASKQQSTALIASFTGYDVASITTVLKLIEAWGIDFIGFMITSIVYAIWPKSNETKRSVLPTLSRQHNLIAKNDNLKITYAEINRQTGLRVGDVKDVLQELERKKIISHLIIKPRKSTQYNLRRLPRSHELTETQAMVYLTLAA